MDLNMMSSLQRLSQISKIRQTQVHCPIVNQRAIVGVLLTEDDLALRTAVISPDLYELELSKLIWERTEFPDTAKPPFDEFLKTYSYPDRQVLTWGLFAATYRTFGKRIINCSNLKDTGDSCDWSGELEITANDVIQEDSLHRWEEDSVFNSYTFPIEKTFEGLTDLYKLTFNTYLPTISRHIDVMKLLPLEKIKANFEKFGNIFSRPELLSIVTKSVDIYKNEHDQNPENIKTARDIHFLISKYLPLDMTDDIFDKYNEKFGKYVPNFKKIIMCPECGQKIEYSVNIELDLMRQFFRR